MRREALGDALAEARLDGAVGARDERAVSLRLDAEDAADVAEVRQRDRVGLVAEVEREREQLGGRRGG